MGIRNLHTCESSIPSSASYILTICCRWRHLIPLLPKDAPVFAPDLPGYGASGTIEKNDKLTVGITLMSALRTEIKRTSSKSIESVPVVLIGHDRGARVAHRLAVTGVEGVDVLGVCLIDIVSPASLDGYRERGCN